MTASAPETALPLAGRLRRVRARAGALFLDSLLVAYAGWCANVLQVRWAGGEGGTGWFGAAAGVLGTRPWVILLAPLLASAWQATGRSLGLLGAELRVERAGGRPATPDLAAFRALVQATLLLLVVLPVGAGWALGGGGVGPSIGGAATALLALGLALDALADPRGRGLADRLAGTEVVHRRGAERLATPWWRRPNPWIVSGLLALTFAVGGILVEFDLAEFLTGAERTRHLWERLLHPDWSIAGRVGEAMVLTVFLALMASVLALPFAFVASFLGARNVMTGSALGSLVFHLTRALMNVARSIEPIVWAIIFTLWVGVGPFAGTLALFIHSVAALGKLYSEAVEGIDAGPVEAIQATGAGRLQTLRYGVVPQLVPPFLSFTVYRWDINVRMATILGFVGGGGIGELLMNYQQLGAWSKVGTILLFITIVVWMLDWVSSKARERLR